MLQTLLSQLVNFHTFPRDAGRFRAALGLVLAAVADPSADPRGTGLFAPLALSREKCEVGKAATPPAAEDDSWTLLVARLGIVCLHYIAEVGKLAGVGGKGSPGRDAMNDDDNGSGGGLREVSAAAESAVEAFALISSPEEWRRRGLLESTKVAEGLCRRLLVSLALGRLVLRGDGGGCDGGGGGAEKTRILQDFMIARKEKPGRKSSIRLAVRADVDGLLSGCWTRAPRLFGVLRVMWDATAGSVTTDTAGAAVRLLCSSSLEALGIGAGGAARTVEAIPPSAEAETSTPPISTFVAVGETLPDEIAGRSRKLTPLLDNRVLLETFASAVLSAPTLLEHPLRALLVDPMLAGDAGAWWVLVTVVGDAQGATEEEGVVGGGSGGDGAARRRDVAWTVANVLKVTIEFFATVVSCCARCLKVVGGVSCPCLYFAVRTYLQPLGYKQQPALFLRKACCAKPN